MVITSPPFCLLTQKEYGNFPQDQYIEWLTRFARKIKDILAEDGSFVLDLGGVYEKDKPIRSLYNYRILIRFCDELGFKLAEEFFWCNTAKLPSPTEWVNRRKIRVKDAINTVWWFSKSDFPKADVNKVLVPYSREMQKLLREREKYYKATTRPSGHGISRGFDIDRGGAIPSNYLGDSNILKIANTESNTRYLRNCRIVKTASHPARFPKKLPDFFIKFLTGPDDVVLDIFAGSNTTGEAAEDNNRKWISFEIDKGYVASSALRFIETNEERVRQIHNQLLDENATDIDLSEKMGLNNSLDLPIIYEMDE